MAKAISGGIAKRYAIALFESAKRRNAVEAVEQDLIAVQAAFEQAPEAVKLLAQPLLPFHRKAQFLQRTFGGRVHELTLRFLSLLVRRKRIEALEHILMVFKEMVDEWRQIAHAHVVSAVELTPHEQEMIVQRLQEMNSKHIILHTHVDPEIVGGLIIRVGDHLIDLSLRSHLERLRERLKQARIAVAELALEPTPLGDGSSEGANPESKDQSNGQNL